jgi:hypothetical protein
LSDRARVDIRIRLVEGHWALGEYGEAQAALERALDEDCSHPGLRPLVTRLQGAVDSGHAPSELREGLGYLAHRLDGTEPEVAPGGGEEAAMEEPAEVASAPLVEERADEERPASDEPSPPEEDEMEALPLPVAEPAPEESGIEEPPPVAEAPPTPEDDAARPSPLATSTMAELFFEQGLHDKAMQVAEDVLRRNPEDERARRLLARLSEPTPAPDPRVAVLERWLSRVRRRRAEGGLHP